MTCGSLVALQERPFLLSQHDPVPSECPATQDGGRHEMKIAERWKLLQARLFWQDSGKRPRNQPTSS